MAQSSNEYHQRYREQNRERLRAQRAERRADVAASATVTGPWSDDEIATVIAMRAEGATTEQIAKAIGRTYSSVNLRIARLRKEGKL